VGKQENCIVTVHLGYAADDFHCLLDGALFVPEQGSADRQRCRAAGIPDDVGDRGPLVWEVNHTLIYLKDAAGLPKRPYHLLIARNALKPGEVKYFVSNAPPRTSAPQLLLAAFSRWRIGRCFQDGKGEVGLDHNEVRRYLGLQRHLVLSAISYLFLAQVRHELAEKNSHLTVCQVRTAVAALVRSWWLSGCGCTKRLQQTATEIQYAQARSAAARKSHTKTTRRAGIKLTQVPQCTWDTT
jgi:hypothetical protein